jgi:hypothetical protein
MFYGALSTDIKKSSCNWSMFGEWMQTAVTVTNNITESVFNTNLKLKGAKKQLILPNSPEGDAYTIYFEHTDKDELTAHLRRLAFTIQALLQDERDHGSLNAFSWYKTNIGDKVDEKKDLNKYYNALMNAKKYQESTDKKYLGKIFLRIGIAVTSEKPDEYQYDKHTSYRLGVIHYSELAEQEAPWECGFGEWVEKDIVKKVKRVETVDILERPVRSEYIDLLTQTNESVGGFMVFVQYGELYPEDCEDGHNKDLNSMERKRRFIEYHDDAYESLRNSSYPVKIVKVKRDQASMFFIPEVKETTKKDVDTQNVGQQAVDIYNRLCTLMAILPAGSSIGISYATKASGKLQEVTRKTFDSPGDKVDYFGAAVNVAARMEMSTVAHQTREGMTKPLLPDSRVAIAFFGDEPGSTRNIPGYPFSYVVTRLGKEKNNFKKDLNFISYRVDKFDLHDINAGSGKLFMISSSLRGPRTFHVGEEVEFQQKSKWKTGKIEDLSSTDHSATISSDRSTYAGITFDNIRPVIKTKETDDLPEPDVILEELKEKIGIKDAILKKLQEKIGLPVKLEGEEDSAVYNQLKF